MDMKRQLGRELRWPHFKLKLATYNGFQHALDMLSSRECTAGTLVCVFSGCFSCCNALQDIICGDGEHEDAGADGARW